jgi:Sap, sulfolipid-1-addressing protein
VGATIGQLLPFAVVVALSPMPIVAVVLMLVTPKARSNGLAFLAGAVLGIAGLGAIVLAVSSGIGASNDGQPADWVNWVKLILGLALLVLALRQWRARPGDGDEVATPKWMGSVDSFTPAKAFVTALVVVVALNPKNLLVVIAGADVVAEAGLSTGDQVIAWTIFTVIASLGVAVPIGIYFLLGSRAAAILESIKEWMTRNNAVILAVILLVIGVKLVGDAITGFSS